MSRSTEVPGAAGSPLVDGPDGSVPSPPHAHGTTGASVMGGGVWQILTVLAPRVQILVVSVVAARVLGPDDMGRQSYIAFIALTAIAIGTGGVPMAVARYTGRWVGEGREGRVRRLARMAWRVETVAGIAAAAAVFAFGAAQDELMLAWAAAAVGVAIAVVRTVPAQLLAGLQRWREVSRISLVCGFAAAAGVVIALLAGGGIAVMFVIPTITYAVSLVWTTRVARRVRPDVPEEQVPADVRREGLTFVGLMSIQVVLNFVVWERSEFFFLERYAPEAQLAVYSIAFSAVLSLARIPFALGNVALPAFSTLDGAGQQGRIRNGFARLVRVQLHATIPLTAFFVVVAPRLLETVYGSAFSETGTVLQVLMLGFPLLPLGMSGAALLMGVGRLRALVGVYALGAALNIGLDVWLIPAHEAMGAAVANTTSQSAIALLLIAVIARQVGGVALGGASLARSVVGAVMAGMAGALVLLSVPGVPGMVLAGTAVVLVAWGANAVLHGLPAEDAAWLVRSVGGRLGARGDRVLRCLLDPLGEGTPAAEGERDVQASTTGSGTRPSDRR